MQIAVLTLFPELFAPFSVTSFVGRGIEGKQLTLHLESLRAHGLGKHLSVDDSPYGGGSGMVMRPDCVLKGIEAAEAALGVERAERRILLTPQGQRFDQSAARRLSTMSSCVLICGRYEGVDERVNDVLVTDEISIGDYVLSGGEPAAVVLVDAMVRLLPEALGSETSAENDSFSNGLLDCPHYTRPAEFRGMRVPEVLLTGNHAEIEKWRREKALEKTRKIRQDLLEGENGERE